MPIRAEEKHKYPKNWKAIVAEIRERSGDRCECTGQCGRIHVLSDGVQIDYTREPPQTGRGRRRNPIQPLRCHAINGNPHPATGSKVVLTVMHLNHKPNDVRRKGLLHGCQACHLRYDAPMKQKGIRVRRRIAKGDLFGGKE